MVRSTRSLSHRFNRPLRSSQTLRRLTRRRPAPRLAFLCSEMQIRIPKCTHSSKRFAPDHRNLERQAFWAKADCQWRRRAIPQRLRRLHASSPLTPMAKLREGQAPSRRRQESSVLSEANFQSEHSVFIGLISMLVGTDDSERVEAAYRRLWDTGRANHRELGTISGRQFANYRAFGRTKHGNKSVRLTRREFPTTRFSLLLRRRQKSQLP